MKRLLFSAIALLITISLFADKKVDKMDDNNFNWTVYTSKVGSIAFEDGFMVLKSKILPKGNPFNQAEYIKAVEASTVKTYARLPFRGADNYKLRIKYIDPYFGKGIYQIYFNANKGCLEEDNCSCYFFQVGIGGQYVLPGFDGQLHMDKLPIKGKKNMPMEFVLTKHGKDATIELNGIQIYSGVCPLTESGIGFGVLWKKTLKIDEISIEQFDLENDD